MEASASDSSASGFNTTKDSYTEAQTFRPQSITAIRTSMSSTPKRSRFTRKTRMCVLAIVFIGVLFLMRLFYEEYNIATKYKKNLIKIFEVGRKGLPGFSDEEDGWSENSSKQEPEFRYVKDETTVGGSQEEEVPNGDNKFTDNGSKQEEVPYGMNGATGDGNKEEAEVPNGIDGATGDDRKEEAEVPSEGDEASVGFSKQEEVPNSENKVTENGSKEEGAPIWEDVATEDRSKEFIYDNVEAVGNDSNAEEVPVKEDSNGDHEVRFPEASSAMIKRAPMVEDERNARNSDTSQGDKGIINDWLQDWSGLFLGFNSTARYDYEEMKLQIR